MTCYSQFVMRKILSVGIYLDGKKKICLILIDKFKTTLSLSSRQRQENNNGYYSV